MASHCDANTKQTVRAKTSATKTTTNIIIIIIIIIIIYFIF